MGHALDQAHDVIWRTRIDGHGIMRDYVGALPTPEDCALGRPNAIGWWSPIENGPMFTGLYLPAMCERARRRGEPADREKVARLARGLLKCASVSDVPGFIARGVGSDGQCHYGLGSDDQTHPWFLGLHAFLASGLATVQERDEAGRRLAEVGRALAANGWRCPADGAFRGQYRGGYTGHLFRDAARYLHLLRVMHEVTGEAEWLDRYYRAAAELPPGADCSRTAICAQGYPRDRSAIAHIDDQQLWIYVGAQAALASLARLETSTTLREAYRQGLDTNAANARPAIEAWRGFDNADTQVFGHADWRAGYPTWYPQPTQADAERLAQTGDRARLGGRKSYEQRHMRNPLAAAAVVALAGSPADRAAIERAVAHYDYARLAMSEMFLAEVAWYALGDGDR